MSQASRHPVAPYHKAHTRMYVTALAAVLLLAAGQMGTPPCTVCVEWATCTPTTPEPTATPLATHGPPERYVGAAMLGDEPADAHEWLASIGGNAVYTRVIFTNPPQWGWADSAVARATDAGLAVWLVWWVGDDGSPDGDCGNADPATVEALAERIAKRYAGSVSLYSYGFEVDGCSSGWTWAATAQAAYRGHKRGDPASQVALSIAYERFDVFDRRFANQLVAATGGREVADYLAVSHWWTYGKRLMQKRLELSWALDMLDAKMIVGGGGEKIGPHQAEGVQWALLDCMDADWCILYRTVNVPQGQYRYGLFETDGTLTDGGRAFQEWLR